MKLRPIALGLLPLLVVAASVRADDTKKKKEKEKETQDSPIESQDARQALDRVVKRLHAEEWQDAFTAARELVDKNGDKLLLVDETVTKDSSDQTLRGLHGPTGFVLRRKLAALPAEGRDALAKMFGEEAAQKLAAARSSADVPALLDVADRYFPLDEGAEALLAAGDLQLERGCIIGAAQAWRDVVSLHPNAAEQKKAGKRLLALLPLIGDAATAYDVASRFASAKLGDELEGAASDIAQQLRDSVGPDFAVDPSGGLAPIFSASLPHSPSVSKRISLASDEVKGIDWRSQEMTTNQWGQQMPVMRRLLSGHFATDDLVLVHLGKSIFAYYQSDDDSYDPPIQEGELAWVFGGQRGIPQYLYDVMASSALARFGIAASGNRIYATLKTSSIDEAKRLPRGRLVCFNATSGKGKGKHKAYWDTTDFDPSEDDQPVRKKKKEGEKAEEVKEARLSFIGTPIPAGERVYSPAANALEPNETWVVAVDAKDGHTLWKRVLTTSSPFAAQTNPWEAAYPRVMPTPSLSLWMGALIVLSNNGLIEALDPTDGRLLWARTYDRDDDSRNPRQPWRATPDDVQKSLARGYNPPLPLGDMALFLPGDSSSMQLIRLTDGTLLKSHAREKYDYVLGVVKGQIVLSSQEGPGFYFVKHEATVKFAADSSPTVGRDRVVGRGVICKGWVAMPTDKKIVAFRISDKKRKVVMMWEKAEQEMGDLVVGGGRLFSIGARYAHTYKEDE